MLKEFSLWGQKLQDGFSLADDFFKNYGSRILKNPKKIAFVGMGGSGIAGRIVKTFLDKKEGITTHVVDSCDLPAYIDANTLTFVISYSGNTWEVVDVLNQLNAKFFPVIVVAHGGKCVEIAQEKGIPFTLLPKSIAPRFALGHSLGFLMGIFEKLNILQGRQKLDLFIKNADIYLPKFAEVQYFKDFLTIAEGYEFFHVWGVSGDSAAFAYRAQTQFNENSKVHCASSSFPELNHNLINGFTNCKEHPFVLFFYSQFLSFNLNLAVEATCDILKENKVALYKPPVLGDTFEGQLFNMILWSDFASYYLGKARGVDVEAVEIIKDLKGKQRTKGIK
jgi:glucose/mannose-6-phosphate isomerase